MNFYIYGYTDKGPYRLKNEDAMLINKVSFAKPRGGFGSVCISPLLAAVCDGVGGHNAGELASQMCISSLAAINYDSSVDLDRCIQRIHNKIKRTGVSGEGTVNMQTTLCLLAVDEYGSSMCLNVGDSRMYRYVNGCIRQISVDQTYGRVLQDPQIEHFRFVNPFGEEPDDTVLICSDGLSGFITKDELEIAMQITSMSFNEKLEALVQLAIRNGSTDNVSIVGIKPWTTPEQYERLTGTPLSNKRDEDAVRAQMDCLEYQLRYESQKLEDLADKSFESLLAELED